MSEVNYPNEYLLESVEGVDMTAAIEEKLEKYGVCVLTSGTYLVHGVNMPDHSTLRGVGRCSRILLDPKLESGYAVGMGSFSVVEDLVLLGAEKTSGAPKEMGDRHGILYLGTATTKNWMGEDLKLHSVIENCCISGFTGGGITCRDTGYYIRAALTATNCHIMHCGAGIYIPHFSEYHIFTNMLCAENLYGCINNGGNNMFLNCGFNANVTGFVIDNSKNQSQNNSHGSAVGCTFNHSDDNRGVGIALYGAQWGYVFSGCQMFYSKIIIENSFGIQFTGMNFGRNMDISVKGGGVVSFQGSVFQSLPARFESEGSAVVRCDGCYTRDGDVILAPENT